MTVFPPSLVVGSGLLVVLPTKEERTNLPRVLQALRAVVPLARVLVVDDHSVDGTGVLADTMARDRSRLEVMHRSGPPGLGPAYCAGFAHALTVPGITHVAQMDADLSHRPGDLPRLLAAARSHDLVLGSRYVPGGGVEGWAAHRRLLSRLGNRYVRMVLPEVAHLTDLTGGLKVWRRDALQRVDLSAVRSRGYAFQVEMTVAAVRAGCTVGEVPIRFPDRTAGRSKLDASICGEAAQGVWRLR